MIESNVLSAWILSLLHQQCDEVRVTPYQRVALSQLFQEYVIEETEDVSIARVEAAYNRQGLPLTKYDNTRPSHLASHHRGYPVKSWIEDKAAWLENKSTALLLS